MKFSIIIPTLNEEQIIVDCLTSLQTLAENIEIVLVDGGSTDNTITLAQPLTDKAITSDKGRALQMNVGAQHACGDMLVFLHADTKLPINALTLITEAVNTQRQWGRFDITLTGKHPCLIVIGFFMNWRSRLTGLATGDQAIFVSKALFDTVGCYPEIALMEDIALSKNLKKIMPPLCIHAKVTSSGRRWEQSGPIKTILFMWNLRLRYFLGADPRTLAQLYYRGQFWKT